MNIADKLRKAGGDFRDEPAQLMHKKSILDRRLDHADELASLRRGLGINSAVELRAILQEIKDEARTQLEAAKIDQQAFERLCDRADAIRDKLARAEDNRAKKLRVRKEERKRLLASAKPPFEMATGTDDVWWDQDVRNGRVDWFLSIPAHVRFHITRRKTDGPREIPTAAAV